MTQSGIIQRETIVNVPLTVFVDVTVIKVNGLHLYSTILPYKAPLNLPLIHTNHDATELLCTSTIIDLRADPP